MISSAVAGSVVLRNVAGVVADRDDARRVGRVRKVEDQIIGGTAARPERGRDLGRAENDNEHDAANVHNGHHLVEQRALLGADQQRPGAQQADDQRHGRHVGESNVNCIHPIGIGRTDLTKKQAKILAPPTGDSGGADGVFQREVPPLHADEYQMQRYI